MKAYNISFYGQPKNYAKIDSFVSRSAQPKREDIFWLKEQGITDIINFRTMMRVGVNFDEKAEAERLGLNYHQISSVSAKPNEETVFSFIRLVEKIKLKGGKIHIHCMAGADRTGMYSFIYKMMHGIGTLEENKTEWLSRGLHTERYPELMQWAENFVKKYFH